MNLHDAQALAVELMREHGLGGSGWSVGFDSARRRFGQCDYQNRRISLSRHLVELNDETQVRDTILHEIAHALTPGADHGWAWKQACVRIGANPERSYELDEVAVPQLATRRKRYVSECPTCGVRHERARLPKYGIGSVSCGKCDTKFNSTHVLRWFDQSKRVGLR